MPNSTTYPFQHLWDSCFHALIWNKLGNTDRALSELENIFINQNHLGLVPHINYFEPPQARNEFWVEKWGRAESSSISQPPMYGHTIAELVRSGVDVPKDLVDKAAKGLKFFLQHRESHPVKNLVYIVHPWESGLDNSPRWDDFYPYLLEGAEVFEERVWSEVKLELLRGIQFQGDSSISSREFKVASVGFNALLAFNIIELAETTGAIPANAGLSIRESLITCFDEELMSWADPGTSTGRTRTLDGLLAGLVCKKDRGMIFEQLADPQAFGGAFGPPSVHRQEPSFQPDVYWRGSTWPQMTYLFWLMTQRAGAKETSNQLSDALVKGALRSGFAEHWNADTGEGLGAAPQSWAGLALLAA